MKTFSKVVSVLVMIISALLVIVMLAGIYGVWWGNSQLRGIVTDVVTLADGTLERAQTVVGEVNDRVVRSQGRLDGVATLITKAGATVEQTNLAVVAAEELLDRDLTPAMEQLAERVTGLRDTIAMLDRTVSLWQLSPRSGDSKVLSTVDAVIGKFTTLDQTLTETRASIKAAKTQATETVVSTLTDPINRVTDRLGAVSGNLTELAQAIDAQQAELLVLRDRLHRLITLLAIVFTLAFLWMALAQLGLFVHAYGVFTGRDPLARWHGAKNADASVAPVA
jgi:hypothetical protein